MAECGRPEAVSAVTADLTDPDQLAGVLEAVGDRAVDAVVNSVNGGSVPGR